ncbi:M15 family metallopeptidase [Paenibacillus sp. FSL M7-0896]|uniref:M15 family metallopeptidase n=1 Tax=Paenibacillus sp. FSL M7-0896 TaxID=2921610 RepID=UPI0030DAD9A7
MLTLDQVQKKSLSRLNGLHPAVKAATTALIERSYARGVPIIITQGLRTKAEQNAYYAKGRTQQQLDAAGLSHVKAQPKEDRVTNAIGGTSNHNYGLAIDFALLLPNGSSVSYDMIRDGDGDKVKDWDEVVQEAKALGFKWGGDFTSIFDGPHFEMTFGLGIKDLQAGAQPTETQTAVALARIERYMKEAEDVKVDKAATVVNGNRLSADSVLIEGRVYAPLAAIGEAIGAKVEWNNVTKTATITMKGAK